MVNKAGGWRNGEFLLASSWTISSNLYKDHYLGSSAFFSFGIQPDDLNSSKPVIKVHSYVYKHMSRPDLKPVTIQFYNRLNRFKTGNLSVLAIYQLVS